MVFGAYCCESPTWDLVRMVSKGSENMIFSYLNHWKYVNLKKIYQHYSFQSKISFSKRKFSKTFKNFIFGKNAWKFKEIDWNTQTYWIHFDGGAEKLVLTNARLFILKHRFEMWNTYFYLEKHNFVFVATRWFLLYSNQWSGWPDYWQKPWFRVQSTKHREQNTKWGLSSPILPQVAQISSLKR